MAVATWLNARTRRQGIAWAHTQMEIAVLSLFFALGSPVLTVGLYFCLWHSVRHIVRLELLDPRGAELLCRGVDMIREVCVVGQTWRGSPLTSWGKA